MRKPHSTVVVLGPRRHGKTTLTLGLLRGPRDATLTAERAILSRARELPIKLARAEIETARRCFTLLDPGEPLAVRWRLVAGPSAGLPAIEGALIVVDPALGCDRELAEDLRLLRRVGVSGLVLFLNQIVPAEPEQLDLAELELREALCDAGLAGDEAPIVRGSARELMHAGAALHEALDEHVPLAAEPPPRLVVAAIVATEVECRVLQGGLAPGERIEIVGISPTRTAQLASLTVAAGEPGQAGALVRCVVRGAAPEDLRVGQVLARPGAIAAHNRFEAEVRHIEHDPTRSDEWLFSFFDVFTVGGVARPLGSGSRRFDVELSTAVALAPGDGFGVVSRGVLVAAGVVTAVRGTTRKRRRGALSPAGVALSFVDTLARGDRPDVAASSLFPPEDVLQATARGFAEDVRPFVLTGSVLLRLVDDARRGGEEHREFHHFSYRELAGRPAHVEYLGVHETQPPRRHARGEQASAYFVRKDRDGEMREYRLTAGVTLIALRFRLEVTREGRRDGMLVEMTAAEFEVRKGTWYLFDFEFPYPWQKF